METKIPYWQSTKCPLKKRGIRPKHTKLTADEVAAIINLYETGEYTYNEIARRFNKHHGSIGRALNKRGYKAINPSLTARKYSINENYFENIDTECKAYYLGFLFADGHNGETNNKVTITLKNNDEYILRFLLKEIESDSIITHRSGIKSNGEVSGYSILNLCNKKISKDLINHGCMGNKTFKIIFPTTIQPDLLHHFVRGYFDGDGCIYISKKIPSNMNLNFVSNKVFLNGLQESLIRELGLNKVKIGSNKHTDERIGNLTYSGRNNCVKLRGWMYKDATTFLTRKRDKLYSI